MGTKQNPNQAVPIQKTELCLGPKIPSQAVQDKQTELHMTAHKKMGTKKNPNQAVPDKKQTTHVWAPKFRARQCKINKRNYTWLATKKWGPKKIQTRQCQIKNLTTMSGPKIPSQAVQDKQTELHMTAHKKMGTKQNPNQAVPDKKRI